MKNFRKSRKALSPVVASIILIAVTVAVSIAVAAWMGALSVGFMQTEQMSITNVRFENGAIQVDVLNTGTTDVTVTSATVNGQSVTANNDAPQTILKNADDTVELSGYTYASGENLMIKLMSAKGNTFPYSVVVP